MPHKGLYEALAAVLFLSCVVTAYSKEINRYMMLHKNRKNESVVEPSPLGSGYDQTTAVEFQFRQNTSEAMKRRVRMVFPPVEEPEEDEELDEAAEIFGKSGKYSWGDDTTIEELEEETLAAIENQKKEEKLKLEEQRKQNIASYAANVAAKIKREKEAALAAALGLEEEEEEPIWTESYGPTEEIEEEYDEDSVVLITDSSGKIIRKQKNKDAIASDTASATANVASGTANIASSTAKVTSKTSKVASDTAKVASDTPKVSRKKQQ